MTKAGEAALQALEAKPFDIVVTDMRMPGMDGATLLTKVREISPITVRIILSGHTELEAAMCAIPVAHRFLAKPAEIGAYLLGIWGLPQPIVDAIAHHHHPTRVPHTGLDPISAVYIAALLADGGTPGQADQDTLKELGLTEQFAEWQKSLPQQALAAKA
jgi:CheY-like chemotaxis protein